MSLYPIYIDSSVAGAQLSIGTTNASKIIIGPVSQDGTANISTVINGVRIDSHNTNNNLLVSFGKNKYQVTSSDTLTNQCNTAVSNWAFGINNMTGNYCTAVGHNSLPRNTTAEYNTAIGSDTLRSVTTGGFNTALGGRALNLTTNSSNVGIGYNALASSVTTTHPNVAVGTNALQNFNNTNVGGGGNTAIGHNALAGLTTGTGNLAIGYIADNLAGAGSINTTGNDNTIIGNSATSSGFSNTIVIGKGAVANAANQIILGAGGGGHTTWIQGTGGLQVNQGPTSLQSLNAGATSLGSTSINSGNSFTTNGPTIFGTNQASGFSTIRPANEAGLVLGWNTNTGQGDTAFLNYAQGGSGGFRFITTNSGSDYSARNAAPIFCGSLGATGSGSFGGVTTIGNSTPPTGFCCLGITTINAEPLRDGIAIKAAATNGMDFMQFRNQAGSGIGAITNTGGTGTGVSYSSNSDRRLKKDIIQMENILDKIMLLKPCNYKWISNETPSFGFIAQEVFKIFPNLYNEIPNSDGNIDEPCDKNTGEPLHYGLDYGRFTPYIVKAMQEQNTIVTNLQKENDDLKSRLSAIEARLAAAGI